nr:hypothetical protein [uncultured Draconibacterium sp.]
MNALIARLFGSMYVWIVSNMMTWISARIALVSVQPIMQEISVTLGVLSGIVLFISSIQLMKKRSLDMERQKLDIEKEKLEIEIMKAKISENESD